MRTYLKQPIVIEIAQLKGYKQINRINRSNHITALKNSIARDGLRQPITIDSKYRVLSGKRRVKAFRALGKTTIPAIYIDSAA